MRSPWTLALLFVMACGSTAAPPATTGVAPERAPDDPGAPPAATPGAPEDVTPQMADRQSPSAATTAYLEAAIAGKDDEMFALMSPECREKEKAWEQGFTRSLSEKKIQLRTFELREPEVNGDAATVAVKAVFVAGGRENDEGMRFELKQQEPEGWTIVAIR